MSKPKVRRIPVMGKAPPREVPDCNRPLSDRGPNPGGLPPKPISSAWKMVQGTGARYHTHS